MEDVFDSADRPFDVSGRRIIILPEEKGFGVDC